MHSSAAGRERHAQFHNPRLHDRLHSYNREAVTVMLEALFTMATFGTLACAHAGPRAACKPRVRLLTHNLTTLLYNLNQQCSFRRKRPAHGIHIKKLKPRQPRRLHSSSVYVAAWLRRVVCPCLCQPPLQSRGRTEIFSAQP